MNYFLTLKLHPAMSSDDQMKTLFILHTEQGILVARRSFIPRYSFLYSIHVMEWILLNGLACYTMERHQIGSQPMKVPSHGWYVKSVSGMKEA
jgi:hypothetical protein